MNQLAAADCVEELSTFLRILFFPPQFSAHCELNIWIISKSSIQKERRSPKCMKAFNYWCSKKGQVNVTARQKCLLLHTLAKESHSNWENKILQSHFICSVCVSTALRALKGNSPNKEWKISLFIWFIGICCHIVLPEGIFPWMCERTSYTKIFFLLMHTVGQLVDLISLVRWQQFNPFIC